MLQESATASQKNTAQESFPPSRVATGLQALNASLEKLEIAMSRILVSGAGQGHAAAHARLAEENARLVSDNQQLMQSLEAAQKERAAVDTQFKALSSRLDRALSQMQALLHEKA